MTTELIELVLDMLTRMPIADSYARKLPTEYALLPKLAKYLSIPIPAPIKTGIPFADYSYPFSIYKWLEGRSANHVIFDDKSLESIALNCGGDGIVLGPGFLHFCRACT